MITHYWWGGPNDGGEVDIQSCMQGLIVAKYVGTARYIFDDAPPLDISFTKEHWQCMRFLDQGKIKHYLVPPGFQPPPAYEKVRDEACNWDVWKKPSSESGLI